MTMNSPIKPEVSETTQGVACHCGSMCEHGWAHARGCQGGCIESVCIFASRGGIAFADDLLDRVEVVFGRRHPHADAEQTERIRNQIAYLFDVHTRKVRWQAQ